MSSSHFRFSGRVQFHVVYDNSRTSAVDVKCLCNPVEGCCAAAAAIEVSRRQLHVRSRRRPCLERCRQALQRT
jgi:hypothetical protein